MSVPTLPIKETVVPNFDIPIAWLIPFPPGKIEHLEVILIFLLIFGNSEKYRYVSILILPTTIIFF